jgi:hypothetical protein
VRILRALLGVARSPAGDRKAHAIDEEDVDAVGLGGSGVEEPTVD